MFQLLLRFLRTISWRIRERRTLIYAGIYLASLWIVATLLFHLCEQVSLFDAFYWSVTTTTTVGYGDIVAQTVIGKIASIAVMLSGIGILGLLLASFTDILIERSLKRRHLIRSFMEDHVVVCGWDNKLEIAVKELLAAGMEVAVVAEAADIPLVHEKLIFIKGDPSDDENLKRANAENAAFALISGKDETETLLSAIAVEKLKTTIHTTCIVSDPKVAQALKKTGVEQTLSADEFFGLILSRSVFVPEISSFLSDMLGGGGMDLHQERIPTAFEGMTFFEILTLLKEQYDTIPVGFVRDSRVTLNPDKGAILRAGDELMYIAEKKLKLGSPL
ncbi:MAG: NAD-binding protein [Methanomicrobia archaeon]|nr:NAD-binding protein [Methanomicrobia archaeon]